MFKADLEYCGLQVKQADIKVKSIGLSNKPTKQWIFDLEIKNCQHNLQCHESYTIDYVENKDPVSQAYEYLKLQPEFSNIVNC